MKKQTELRKVLFRRWSREFEKQQIEQDVALVLEDG